jgi:hypothetical protein
MAGGGVAGATGDERALKGGQEAEGLGDRLHGGRGMKCEFQR